VQAITEEPHTPTSKGFGAEIFKIFGGGGSGSASSGNAGNAQKKATRGERLFERTSTPRLTFPDGQQPKRRGPKPDSKPALTRRQELNRQAQR
jgi:hypothetical protein